jgi:hypothetical protein
MSVTIGTTPEFTDKRDAIHVPVAPVVAAEDLEPGCHVALNAEGRAFVPWDGRPTIGVVDPFLTETVYSGGLFWLLLPPGTVQAVRHEWTHPSVRDNEAMLHVEDDYCRSCGW